MVSFNSNNNNNPLLYLETALEEIIEGYQASMNQGKDFTVEVRRGNEKKVKGI